MAWTITMETIIYDYEKIVRPSNNDMQTVWF